MGEELYLDYGAMYWAGADYRPTRLPPRAYAAQEALRAAAEAAEPAAAAAAGGVKQPPAERPPPRANPQSAA